MFSTAYHRDPKNFSNRAFTDSGQHNAPGIVQQYFLAHAKRPVLLEGGDYNLEGGANWAGSWLWPRSTLLQKKKILISIRKLFTPPKVDWDSDDDLDICMHTTQKRKQPPRPRTTKKQRQDLQTAMELSDDEDQGERNDTDAMELSEPNNTEPARNR